MKSRTTLWTLLAACFLCCPSAFAQDEPLEIDRPKPEPITVDAEGIPSNWKKLDGDLYLAEFRVPPDFLRRDFDVDEDPFGGDDNLEVIKSAKTILEEFGIPFEDGASAVYNSVLSILIVVNTREALEMITTFVGGIEPKFTEQIAIRFEIYEMSTLRAMQLLESAQSEVDHTPERQAALRGVGEGKTKLVAVRSLASENGLRAKLNDTTELVYPIEFSTTPATGGSVPSHFDTNRYGTILEQEAYVELDDTINLTFILEYHTAAPEIETLKGGITAPRFHGKMINTTLELANGGYVIVGNWKPTGKPEHAEKDLLQVVFVTATSKNK